MYSRVRFSSDLTVDNEYKFASTTLYVAARYLKKMSQPHPPDGSTLYTEARYTTVLNKVSQLHPPDGSTICMAHAILIYDDADRGYDWLHLQLKRLHIQHVYSGPMLRHHNCIHRQQIM